MKKITTIATIAMASFMMMAAPVASFAAESADETESVTEAVTMERLSFEDAVAIATDAAGLSAEDVTFSKKMQTFEDGVRVYEIEFMIPGETRYEFTINAKTGDIMDQDTEDWEAEDDEEYAGLLAENQNLFDFNAAETQIVVMPAANTVIEEVAKDRQEDLCYYKDGFEYDDGRIIYVFGVMFPQETKFEYKFDMNTGAVIDNETESWEAEDNAEYRELLEEHNLM